MLVLVSFFVCNAFPLHVIDIIVLVSHPSTRQESGTATGIAIRGRSSDHGIPGIQHIHTSFLSLRSTLVQQTDLTICQSLNCEFEMEMESRYSMTHGVTFWLREALGLRAPNIFS